MNVHHLLEPMYQEWMNKTLACRRSAQRSKSTPRTSKYDEDWLPEDEEHS
jgi:hypothetical protein